MLFQPKLCEFLIKDNKIYSNIFGDLAYNIIYVLQLKTQKTHDGRYREMVLII